MMDTAGIGYLIDANVIINAARHYYRPSLTRIFWDSLGNCIKQGSVCVLKIVADEIAEAPKSYEAEWIASYADYFLAQKTAEVTEEVKRIYDFLNSDQFKRGTAAKWKLEADADPWLGAIGLARGWTVVTEETDPGDPEKGGRIGRPKIPFVCRHLGVRCINTFQMLEELGIVVDSGLRAPSEKD